MSERKGVMLAKPYNPNLLAKWGKPWLVQPKYDGDRCKATINNGSVSLYSSSGREITGVPHIVEALKVLPRTSEPLILDGELYAPPSLGMPHEVVSGIVRTQIGVHPDAEKLRFVNFDVISQQKQFDRWRVLRMIWGDFYPHAECVHQAITIRANTLQEVETFLSDCMYQGYEGIIIRNCDALYEEKRTSNMMKVKPRGEDWYRIVGMKEEISLSGVLKNALGAFVCAGEGGETFSIGSGPLLTRDNRKRFWEMGNTLIGKWLHVKYQNLTERGIPRGGSICVQIEDTPPQHH